MNFLFAGFLLIIVNVNLSMWVTYIVKTVGFVLIIAGIAEYSIHDKGVKSYRTYAVANTLMNTFFIVAMLYADYKLESKYINYAGVLCGAFSTILSIDLQKRLMSRILRSGEGKIVEDTENHKLLMPFVADIKRLGKAWNKLTAAVIVNLVFDILNRLVKADTLVTVFGVIAAASKVVCIVFALVFLLRFNELRDGYEKTMEKLDNT